MSSVSLNDEKYATLRQRLDEMGYPSFLALEAAPLVETIFEDLLKTTYSLKVQKEKAADYIEDIRVLQLSVDPYEKENADLTAQCNNLHKKLIQVQETHQTSNKELRLRVRRLENENAELGILSKGVPYGDQNQNGSVGNGSFKTTESGKWKNKGDSLGVESRNSRDPLVSDMIRAADSRVLQLQDEVRTLIGDRSQLEDEVSELREKVVRREKEVERLTEMVNERKSPKIMARMNKQQTTSPSSQRQHMERTITQLLTQIDCLHCTKKSLEHQLQVSVDSQHEAMTRAMALSDENDKLKERLTKLQQSESYRQTHQFSCTNSPSKEHLVLQGRLDKALAELETLTTRNRDLIAEKTRLFSMQNQLEDNYSRSHTDISEDAKRFKRLLNMSEQEKKVMGQKVEELTLHEHELLEELDRLMQIGNNNISSSEKVRVLEMEKKHLLDQAHELTAKLKTYYNPQTNNADYQRIKSDCERLQQSQEICARQLSEVTQSYQQALDDKESLLVQLENLRREVIRYQQPNDELSSAGQTLLRRAEEEKQKCREDSRRLRDERDTLLHRLEIANESQGMDKSRLEKVLSQTQAKLDRTESELKDTMMQLSTQKGALRNAEERYHDAQDKLKQVKRIEQEERALSHNTKSLLDQAERQLMEVRGDCNQLAEELQSAQATIGVLENQMSSLTNEFRNKDNEHTNMRASLGRIDKDRDLLQSVVDDKTEKVAALEVDLSNKETFIKQMQDALKLTEQKYQKSKEESDNYQRELRRIQREADRLRREHDGVNQHRESLLRENRNLQDLIATSTKEARDRTSEVQIKQEECAELKRQIQLYIAEVHRVEEILSHKEDEQTQLLDHYRSLSLEASTLENMATAKDDEARTAQERADTLQREVSTQQTIARSYGTQMNELCQKVARFESQLMVLEREKEMALKDSSAARELVIRLEKQRDELQGKYKDEEMEKMQIESSAATLRDELLSLRSQVVREQENVQSLEELLALERERNFRKQLAEQTKEADLNHYRAKAEQLTAKLATAESESKQAGLHNVELETEIERLRRKLSREKFQTHRKNQELERVKSRVGSPVSFNNSSISAYSIPTSKQRDIIGSSSSLGQIPSSSTKVEVHYRSSHTPSFISRYEEQHLQDVGGSVGVDLKSSSGPSSIITTPPIVSATTVFPATTGSSHKSSPAGSHPVSSASPPKSSVYCPDAFPPITSITDSSVLHELPSDMSMTHSMLSSAGDSDVNQEENKATNPPEMVKHGDVIDTFVVEVKSSSDSEDPMSSKPVSSEKTSPELEYLSVNEESAVPQCSCTDPSNCSGNCNS